MNDRDWAELANALTPIWLYVEEQVDLARGDADSWNPSLADALLAMRRAKQILRRRRRDGDG